MGATQNDLLDYYDQDIGPTYSLAASTSVAFTTDAVGPLPPGKYLVQAPSLGGTDLVFISLVPFKAGDTPSISAQAPATPIIRGWLEFNVKTGDNDRVVIRATGGTGTVYITQVSRIPKRLPPV